MDRERSAAFAGWWAYEQRSSTVGEEAIFSVTPLWAPEKGGHAFVMYS
jgi:hypothetical protein